MYLFRHGKLYYFDGIKIYNLFIPPTILFIVWTLSIYFNFGPNQIKKDFFRNITMQLYDEDIDKISFMGPLYFVSYLIFYFSFDLFLRPVTKMEVVFFGFLIYWELLLAAS